MIESHLELYLRLKASIGSYLKYRGEFVAIAAGVDVGQLFLFK